MKPLIVITFFIVSSFSTGGYSALRLATRGGRTDIAKLLINDGVDIFAGRGENALDVGKLRLATRGGRTDIAKLLINDGVDIFAGRGENALDVGKLRLAARRGHTEIVELLIKNGVDIFAGRGEKALDVEKMMKSEARLAPTEIVATSASLPSAESHALLPVEEETFAHAIGQYLSVRVKVITESIRSCIACLRDKLTSYTATLGDSFQPVEEEIARTLAATESIGEAIILDVTTEEIKQLISQGANVERRDENGRTALMLAALLGKWREISLLLDAGAEVNAQDNDGNTALHLALEVGHHETVALLRSRGADASTENNAGITTLALAQESEDKVLLELVQIERPEQGSRQAQRDTANKLLQRAAAHDSHSQPQTEDEQKLLD